MGVAGAAATLTACTAPKNSPMMTRARGRKPIGGQTLKKITETISPMIPKTISEASESPVWIPSARVGGS